MAAALAGLMAPLMAGVNMVNAAVAARDRGIPIRIGVNAGSLEKDLQKKYGEPTPEALLELLADRQRAADSELPSTGVPLEWERLLSSIFIASPGYGTRASTALLHHADGRLVLHHLEQFEARKAQQVRLGHCAGGCRPPFAVEHGHFAEEFP